MFWLGDLCCGASRAALWGWTRPVAARVAHDVELQHVRRRGARARRAGARRVEAARYGVGAHRVGAPRRLVAETPLIYLKDLL